MMHKFAVTRPVIFSLLLSLGSCTQSPVPIPSEVTIIAHGGGAAHWIRNSRNAVQQLVAAKLSPEHGEKFHGIEVDLVLTADNIPVLAHDPWISTDLCTSESRILTEELLIRNLTIDEIRADIRCGGTMDTQHPQAKLRSETILDFEEFLELISASSDLLVYLDLKIQLPLTKSAKEYANAIRKVWDETGVSNPLVIEIPTAEAAAEFTDWRTHQQFDLVLSYPPYYAGDNWTLAGGISALRTYLHSNRPVEFAQTANADAISSLMSLLPRSSVHKLHQNGVDIVAFTAVDREQLESACRSGAKIVITDVPLAGPCP